MVFGLNALDREIKIIEVHHSSDLYTFIRVPHFIYENDYYWPGQNDLEEVAFMDPRSSVVMRDIVSQPFVAVKGGEVIGRICGLIWESFNERWKKNVAFFGFFECIDNQEAADCLFRAVENWARQKGKTEIWGPFSPNIVGTVGIRVDGFKKIPISGLAYNPTYYAHLCERYGFTTEKDLIELSFDIAEYSRKAEELEQSIVHLRGDESYNLRCLDKNKLDEELHQLAPIYAQGFKNHWGSGEISVENFIEIINEFFRPLLIPELFFIIEHNQKPVAFFFCLFDQNITKHAKKESITCDTRRVEMYLTSILKEYQGKKIATWLYCELARQLIKLKVDQLSAAWAVKDNHVSVNSLLKYGAEVSSVFRVYKKDLVE